MAFTRANPAKNNKPSASLLSTDGRRLLSTVLWTGGVFLALVGNWLRWDWLAVRAPESYPDQVWGDLASSGMENALVITDLILGIAVFAVWRLTSPGRRYAKGSWLPIFLTRLGSTLKWLTISITAAAVVAISILLYRYLESWWLLFPGWLGELLAQICILIGASSLPAFSGPHRGLERERSRPAALAASLAVIAAIALPFPVASFVSSTQAVFESHADEGDRATRVDPISESSPWGYAGLSGFNDNEEPVWRWVWRGAQTPETFPSVDQTSTLLQLSQATPSRPSLFLVSSGDGKMLAQMTSAQLDALGLDTKIRPELGRFLFSSGNTIIQSGMGKEWVSDTGERLMGPPKNYVEEAKSRLSQTDGLHGLNVVSGVSWFVGDGGGCARRVIVIDDQPVFTSAGQVVMLQVCDREVQDSFWSLPTELEKTVSPLTATLFAVQPEDGSIIWSAGVSGFSEWAQKTGAVYPSADSLRLPIGLDLSGNELELTVEETKMLIDLSTGETR